MYYNIYNQKLGAILEKAQKSNKTDDNRQDIKSYIKGKSFLNIHLDDLIELVKDKTIRNEIRANVINLLNKINKIEKDDYKSKLTNKHSSQKGFTEVQLLKFQNKLKIKKSFFSRKLKSFNKITSQRAKINKKTWDNTRDIILKSGIINEAEIDNKWYPGSVLNT